MPKFLTIFNLTAGAASISGLLVQVLAPNEVLPFRILLPIFAIAALVAVWVLLVPGTPLEENTARNLLTVFADQPRGELEGNVMIQRGTVRFRGFRASTVVFHEPFLDAPQIELADRFGDFAAEGMSVHPSDAPLMPEILQVTPHQAQFKRSGGRMPYVPRCEWIARGRPLYPAPPGSYAA
jgi:hypothetical protein